MAFGFYCNWLFLSTQVQGFGDLSCVVFVSGPHVSVYDVSRVHHEDCESLSLVATTSFQQTCDVMHVCMLGQAAAGERVCLIACVCSRYSSRTKGAGRGFAKQQMG